jgi:hypothetical protein
MARLWFEPLQFWERSPSLAGASSGCAGVIAQVDEVFFARLQGERRPGETPSNTILRLVPTAVNALADWLEKTEL